LFRTQISHIFKRIISVEFEKRSGIIYADFFKKCPRGILMDDDNIIKTNKLNGKD